MINWETYRDKVMGGWAGKSLGGTVGAFEGTKRITHFRVPDLLPEGMIPNDDLDIQLVWLDVLLEKGVGLESGDLMQAWIERYPFHYGEYAYGKRNARRDVAPPVSGAYGNEYYRTGMGCPIRSEVWGMIAPGTPELAARYAYLDGVLDHEGESVWAEQFLAAMEALAFVENDIPALLEAGLRYAPRTSRLYGAVADARAGYEAGLPWEETWRMLVARYGHPDCTYAPFNLGIIAMALLYGAGDMERTLTIAVNSGWDVDCTCSTTAALLGILHGYQNFPCYRELAGGPVRTMAQLKHPMDTLERVTEYTLRAAATLAEAGKLALGLDIPAELPRVPGFAPEPALRLEPEYRGDPAVIAGAEKRMGLLVTNQGDELLRGRLELTGPEGFAIALTGAELTLPPRGEARVAVSLQAPDTGVLWDHNRFVARFVGERAAAERKFGVCGAPTALVLGPYFDCYEDWQGYAPLPESRYKTTPTQRILLPERDEEWGNHRVDIDKPYCREDFSDPEAVRRAFRAGLPLPVYGDNLDLSRAFGFAGPCCAYCLLEVVAEEERALDCFLGSSDPYMLWLNGERLAAQREHRFWFCNNDVFPVRLHPGANQLVIKLARTGGGNRTTLVFRERPGLPGYDSMPFAQGLGFATPRAMGWSGPGWPESREASDLLMN